MTVDIDKEPSCTHLPPAARHSPAARGNHDRLWGADCHPSGWGISSGHIEQIWSMRNPAKLSALTEARLVTG
jgi:hypothetical protein